jgi:hypothetical protein
MPAPLSLSPIRKPFEFFQPGLSSQTILVIASISANIAGVATISDSAEFGGSGALVSSLTGIGSVSDSAEFSGSGALLSGITGVGSESGILVGFGAIASSITGIGSISVTGTLIGSLTSAIVGVASNSGALLGTGVIVGNITGQSSVSLAYPSIAGVTRDANSNPLAGVTVFLFLTSNNTLVASTVSNSSGNYIFSNPGSGPFYIVAYLSNSPSVAGTTLDTLVAQ